MMWCKIRFAKNHTKLNTFLQWRANMMARCGSCDTKKSCSLSIYPQRYTFRTDLRWQVDKQRKHQNWLSLIESCILRQVLFVCIFKVHIFFNTHLFFRLTRFENIVTLICTALWKISPYGTSHIRKKGFRGLKRILNHFEVSEHTTKP